MKLKTRIDQALRTALRALSFGGVSAVALAALSALAPCGAQAEVQISGPIPIAGTNDVYVKFTLSDNTTASTTWTVPDGVTKIDYLVVGGGGGGGSGIGGGGGGGGVKEGTLTSFGSQLSITVGAGGAGGQTRGMEILGGRLYSRESQPAAARVAADGRVEDSLKMQEMGRPAVVLLEDMMQGRRVRLVMSVVKEELVQRVVTLVVAAVERKRTDKMARLVQVN